VSPFLDVHMSRYNYMCPKRCWEALLSIWNRTLCSAISAPWYLSERGTLVFI